MSNNLVTINLVVLNGDKYINHCLNGILTQTYPKELIEFNILDNGSSDNTSSVIRSLNIESLKFKKFNFIESSQNLGMWPGQEELLKYSNGKYILAMAVDVILDRDFIKNAVEVMERDSKIGALEAKIHRYDLKNGEPELTDIIDTLGFKIFKSRRLINIGHGERDTGQYDNVFEIFGVEGACPFFRREALNDCRIGGEIFDHDYFWYGDDFDLAWRMNLLGWKQVIGHNVLAWHDRQTTKKLKTGFKDFREIRLSLPLKKRQLEWKNVRWTIIKNDYIINILRDAFYILKREASMLGYLLIYEPRVLFIVFDFMRLMPRILIKRNEIMKKSKVSPSKIRVWFE